MKYSIFVIAPFDKQLRKLVKKYPSLKEEYANLVQSLKENPTQGIPLSNNCFKIRLAISSKGKGKSGGARVITHIQVIKKSVYLLSVYDKSELENLSDKYIKILLSHIE